MDIAATPGKDASMIAILAPVVVFGLIPGLLVGRWWGEHKALRYMGDEEYRKRLATVRDGRSRSWRDF